MAFYIDLSHLPFFLPLYRAKPTIALPTSTRCLSEPHTDSPRWDWLSFRREKILQSRSLRRSKGLSEVHDLVCISTHFKALINGG